MCMTDQQSLPNTAADDTSGLHLCSACGRPAGDLVTGLDDRWTWATRAPITLHQAQRRGGGVAVLVADLDRFKAINDTYGHLAGDLVLAKVGEALRGVTRADDVVCRAGGDEFWVLLSGVDQNAATVVAGRMRLRVTQLAVDVETTSGCLEVRDISMSVGMAYLDLRPDSDELPDVDHLVRVADNALLTAKAAGVGIHQADSQETR